jgi:hypothetical protein
MKRLIFALLLVAGTLAATKSDAQVYVRAGVHFGIPGPRAYYGPRVAYAAPYYPSYYGGGAVIAGPGYGYGRHFYRDRRWRHCGRW